jgi:glycosyltransferase involved in cell wall biosynthesis
MPRTNGKPPVVLDARVVTGTGGGPEKTLLNSPRFFVNCGYRMVCAYMHPPGDRDFASIERKARERQAPLYAVEDRGPWDWKVFGEMLRICRKERVKIWHGHDYKSNALGLLLETFWPMRLVTTVHGWVKHTRRTPLYYGIDRYCLPKYESVICVSTDLYEQSLQFGVAPERCTLIENAIDTGEFTRRQTIEEAKVRHGCPPGRLLVGGVGRLSKEKGFDFLIAAVQRLIAEGLDVGLWIAGEGDLQVRLQALIDATGQGERIRLLGYQADTRGFFEAMDVFALSSHYEGLPNVILEAMAMEVPIVSTRVPGVLRVLKDGENGLLVESGSAEALSAALGRLLRDPGERQHFRQAARQTIEAGYRFDRRIEKIAAIYNSLLASHR